MGQVKDVVVYNIYSQNLVNNDSYIKNLMINGAQIIINNIVLVDTNSQQHIGKKQI
jgi:hypothetical protein